MCNNIIWSNSAIKDLDSILEYLLENWGAKYSLKFLQLVDKKILSISKNSKKHSLINKEKCIRKCLLTKHNTIYFQDMNDSISILRIFDTRQDPDKLKL